ncbi:type II secretion system F family protein [Promicromonospora sp. NPDC023987]|uniref:type II secretion system F family protein n=1 Tax=Promicromonospora sp. NPDC023987 TaxID=3155360 RepID=UPI0033E06C91
MWLAILAGAVFGLGVFLLVAWWRAWPLLPSMDAWRRSRLAGVSRRRWMLVGAGLVGGIVVWVVTGMLLALVGIPAAVIGLPTLLSNRAETNQIARLDAMAEWCRSLAGVITVGIGLEQALRDSARSAPTPIKDPVEQLVHRLDARWDTETAIRAFAEDLHDPTGDLIAIELSLAARRRGTGLATMLEAVADSAAADVRSRRQVAADRAKSRATARWVTALFVGVLVVLAFSGEYAAPYTTVLGQIVLAVLIGAYLGTLVWLDRIARGKPPARSLGVQARAERDRRVRGTALGSAVPSAPATAWGGAS